MPSKRVWVKIEAGDLLDLMQSEKEAHQGALDLAAELQALRGELMRAENIKRMHEDAQRMLAADLAKNLEKLKRARDLLGVAAESLTRNDLEKAREALE
jgi:hypothetical protein